jgi:hypothetical protein
MVAGSFQKLLTVIEVLWSRVLRSPDNGELDLLEALALQPSAFLEPLLGLREDLTLSTSQQRQNIPECKEHTGCIKNLNGMP